MEFIVYSLLDSRAFSAQARSGLGSAPHFQSRHDWSWIYSPRLRIFGADLYFFLSRAI